jgi:hypothetical protein
MAVAPSCTWREAPHRHGDALAAHLVKNIDLIGQGAAGKDLEDLKRFLGRARQSGLA